MKSYSYRPAARLVLLAAIVMGTWPALSSAVESPSPTTTSAAELTSPSYHVAQVTLSPLVVAPPQPEAEEETDAGMAADGRPVSYSSEQAARGEESYDSVCEECHGDDLRGGLNGGAPLRGASFEQRFANGASAAALFFYMSNLMPPEAPGRFSDETYIDLMAYILQVNGFQPGAALPTDVDALAELRMER